MGERTYGKIGKITVDICLFLSQAGFVCAYVYFIKENLHHIILYYFDVYISTKLFALLIFILFSLLCLVRRIEIFASTHVFADVMIVVTMIVILAYGGIYIKHSGGP